MDYEERPQHAFERQVVVLVTASVARCQKCVTTVRRERVTQRTRVLRLHAWNGPDRGITNSCSHAPGAVPPASSACPSNLIDASREQRSGPTRPPVLSRGG